MDKHYPTHLMVAAFANGLLLAQQGYGGHGLTEKTVLEAMSAARGQAIPYEKIVRMRAWFRRHASDFTPAWRWKITPGYVANQLWGGWDGWRWAEVIVAKAEGKPHPSARLAAIRDYRLRET